jgi:hypothetical protein
MLTAAAATQLISNNSTALDVGCAASELLHKAANALLVTLLLLSCYTQQRTAAVFAAAHG